MDHSWTVCFCLWHQSRFCLFADCVDTITRETRSESDASVDKPVNICQPKRRKRRLDLGDEVWPMNLNGEFKHVFCNERLSPDDDDNELRHVSIRKCPTRKQ